jgi:hypothetical protein
VAPPLILTASAPLPFEPAFVEPLVVEVVGKAPRPVGVLEKLEKAVVKGNPVVAVVEREPEPELTLDVSGVLALAFA